MPTISKSRNVCSGCRFRKKRCDGMRPSCSSCLKREYPCLYTKPARQRPLPIRFDFGEVAQDVPVEGLSSTGFVGETYDALQLQAEQLDIFQPGLVGAFDPFDSFDQFLSSSLEPDACSSGRTRPPGSGEVPVPEATNSTPALNLLPSTAIMADLVDIYFEKFHYYVPVIHRPSFLDELETSGQAQSLTLSFALCAVSAKAHGNKAIQQYADGWYQNAKSLMSAAIHSASDSLRTLQAAVLVIYESLIRADYPTSWILLGDAWRKAAIIGCPRLDGKMQKTSDELGHMKITSWAEKEEYRRVIWALYMFDRGMCTFDLSLAVDDKSLYVNLPMAEDLFQHSTVSKEPTLAGTTWRYISNMDSLLKEIEGRVRQDSVTMQQFIIIAYALLGDIGEVIYKPDFDYESNSTTLDALSDRLVHLRLLLPPWAIEFSAARLVDWAGVLWLNSIMSAAAIHLYHRPLPEEERDIGQQSSGTVKNWPYCVAASHKLVDVLRDASRIDTGFVRNPLVIPLVFTCSRIITIEYLLTGTGCYGNGGRDKDTLRADLEVLLGVFRQHKQGAGQGSGGKFYNGFVFFLGQDLQEVERVKRGRVIDMLRPCDEWADYAVDEEIEIPWR